VSMSNEASIKEALESAGIEIYRSTPGEVHVAERVRLHIMDSGVRVLSSGDQVAIRFTARSQRSDFPNADSTALFLRVREDVGTRAQERGYEERETAVREVTDPVDEARVLDVWHEVVYEKATDDDSLVDEVRWALSVEKYVSAE
jgi:hypothetical protein